MTSIPQDTPQKKCSKCHEFLPVTFFTKATKNRDGLQSWCPPCRQQYNALHKEEISQKKKQHYQDHRDEKLAIQKRYNEEHKDEIHIRQKAYRQSHPELIREQERRKREKFPEEIRKRKKQWQQGETYKAYQKRYQQEHADTIKVEHEQYYDAHAEELRKRQRIYGKTQQGRMVDTAHRNKRRAQKQSIECTLTSQQIQEKLKSQKYRCYYAACGFAKFEKVDGRYIYHLEHTIPISRTEHNPRHDVNYVVLACPMCNMKKHSKLPHEWADGGRLF